MKGEQDTEARRAEQRRPGILLKLVLAFAVPTLLLFAAFAVVAHEVAKRELETELGKRLTAVASAAAKQIRNVAYLKELDPGDGEDIAYLRTRRDLETMAKATRVSRLYLFDREYHSVVDTGGATAIGAVQFQAELDRTELEHMFVDGEPKASVLFEGKDGRWYKAAYAPVVDERSGEVLLAVGVDAAAEFFERLAPLRRNLFLVGAALIVVLLVVATLVANRITRPIRALVEAADRIGAGNLDEAVAVDARDEIRFLADTMDRMRADLRARDERNQMMLAGIAHEVRNPLGGIELFAGILRDEIDDDDERRAHVDRIIRELDYLKRVVEDFLEYARRPPPELEAIDLAEVAREVVTIASGDAATAGVEVVTELDHTPVTGDEGQLRRAFLNLLRNAIQAGSDDPSCPVRVETRVSGSRCVFSVKNGGPPIADEVRSKMFQPFYTSREKGTGLGLAFVREIVDDHRGNIEVVSDAERGTEFRVLLDLREG